MAVFYNSFTPLHLASSYGYLEIVEFLVSNGANVNAIGKEDPDTGKDYYTPLFFALKKKSSDSVEFLISHGATINVENSIDCANLHLQQKL